LNGVIPAQTPNGWRTDQLSMPRPTCSFALQLIIAANSTTSAPRSIHLGIGQYLAVLGGDSLAIASSSRCKSSRNLNSTRARVAAGSPPSRGRRGSGFNRCIDLARRRARRGATARRLPVKDIAQRPLAPSLRLPPM